MSALEGDSGWELAIAGFEVLQMTMAYGVEIVAYGDSGTIAQVRFEAGFELNDAYHARHRFDAAGEWETLVPLFALRHDRVAEAHATTEGELRLSFESGRTLTARTHPRFTGWEIHAPGMHLLAKAGGGVASFKYEGDT